MKKIAVFLAGCGYLDGAEIRESVGTLWALNDLGCTVECFAPDIEQKEVINTLDKSPMNEKRNVLIEASRIARGEISPLSQFNAGDFDALVLPGGFGVAKNFCTFATQGSNATVLSSVQKAIEDFHLQAKPIGALCIAPALLALVFKNKNFEMTVGINGEASQEIEKLGHRHIEKDAHEFHVDHKNKIASTPAYMYDDGELKDIFRGIHGCLKAVVEMA